MLPVWKASSWSSPAVIAPSPGVRPATVLAIARETPPKGLGFRTTEADTSSTLDQFTEKLELSSPCGDVRLDASSFAPLPFRESQQQLQTMDQHGSATPEQTFKSTYSHKKKRKASRAQVRKGKTPQPKFVVLIPTMRRLKIKRKKQAEDTVEEPSSKRKKDTKSDCSKEARKESKALEQPEKQNRLVQAKQVPHSIRAQAHEQRTPTILTAHFTMDEMNDVWKATMLECVAIGEDGKESKVRFHLTGIAEV
ncbi:hypothetical protein ACM66B_000964 [Microbotryomycetes sp. NB124-2]